MNASRAAGIPHDGEPSCDIEEVAIESCPHRTPRRRRKARFARRLFDLAVLASCLTGAVLLPRRQIGETTRC